MNGCPFCSLRPEQLWLADNDVLAIKDVFPVAEGHTLVLPRAHHVSVFDATAAAQTALWAMVSQVRQSLTDTLSPDGFTIGVNDGLAAGQTVLHGHIHVIPRFQGDVAEPRGGIRQVISSPAAGVSK